MGACLTNLQVHFSRQTIPNDEWDNKRKLWSDVVEGIIPPERLQEVFNRALRNHRDTFPLAVSELIPAWDEIKQEERDRRREVTAARKPCETCIEARSQNVPCPYHGRDYRVFI